MKTFKRLVILLLLLSACKSKQITTESREITRIDTIYKFQDRIIDRPVLDSIIIEQPCDSLGRIKPFTGVLKTNHTKVSVTAKDGRISVIFDQDSIISSIEEQRKVKSEVTNEKTETEIIRYRWPWWVIYLIGYSVLATLVSGYLLFKKWF